MRTGPRIITTDSENRLPTVALARKGIGGTGRAALHTQQGVVRTRAWHCAHSARRAVVRTSRVHVGPGRATRASPSPCGKQAPHVQTAPAFTRPVPGPVGTSVARFALSAQTGNGPCQHSWLLLLAKSAPGPCANTQRRLSQVITAL